MKRQLKPWLYVAAVLLLIQGCFSTPFQSRKTTVSGTVTDFDTKLPIENNEVAIWGNNGVLAYRGMELKTVFTDKNGKYSATIDVPKGYHSLNVDNISDATKYRDYYVFLNRQRTQNCCRVEIGSTAEYDFVMLPK